MPEIIAPKTRRVPLPAGHNVALTVTVGNGQVGGTSLLLDGQPVRFPGQPGPLPIPNPTGSLLGSVLVCITIVQHQNPATLNTSVTYVVDDGQGGQTTIVSTKPVQTAGQRVHYVTTIVFRAPAGGGQ